MRILNYIFLFNIFLGLYSCIPVEVQPQTFAQFLQDLNDTPLEKRNGVVEHYLNGVDKTPVIELDGNVHFIAYAEADSFLVEGDLQNGWSKPQKMKHIDCGNKKFFYFSYEIPNDSQIEYKFVLHRKTILDPMNPDVEINFEYGDRNIFRMPEFKPSPYLAFRPEVNKGTVVPRIMKSKNEIFLDRKIFVYLPPDYTREEQYPVMLVNDGEIKLFTTPYKNVLDNLIHESLIPPIITVFIPALDRSKEYCSQNVDYANYLVDELIPYIKANFSTRDDPKSWGIMGASGGAMISMAAGLLYPEVISNIGAQGGGGAIMPNWCNYDTLFTTYASKRAQSPLNNIFMSVGIFDLVIPQEQTTLLEQARIFHQKLDSLNIEHKYTEYNDGHRDSNWNQSLDDILIQFFGIKEQ